MICQQVPLSGDAEWPKVADAVIEAHSPSSDNLGLPLPSTFHALHNGPYQKSRRGQRQGAAQCPGASAAHGQLRIRMAGLCYDTQHVEAMTFPVAMPDKTPCALSEDFYQEKLPCKPLLAVQV